MPRLLPSYFGAPFLPSRLSLAKTAITDAADAMKVQRIKNIRYDQNKRQNPRLIDLGCGNGRLLSIARKQDFQVVGIESNLWLALFCKFRFIFDPNVTIIWGNMWKYLEGFNTDLELKNSKLFSREYADIFMLYGMPTVNRKVADILLGQNKLRGGEGDKRSVLLYSIRFDMGKEYVLRIRRNINNEIFVYEL